MRSLVSVIIPTYNRADYLPDSIQSVLNQKIDKNHKIEVIVVDDGSTDDTAAVVKKFGKKVRYYKIPHSGLPSVARNVGLTLAAGEYVAFQDSDDIWLNDKLALQLECFEDKSVALVYSNALVMGQGGKVTKQPLVDPKILKNGYVFKDLLKTNFISTSTAVVRRSVLQQVEGFNESAALRAIEDYELWLRMAGLKIGKVKAVNKSLVYYRQHDQSLSHASSIQALERISLVYEAVWQYNQKLKQNYAAKLIQAMASVREKLYRAKSEMDPQWKSPEISVVMSVYNGADHLRASIESIINQTFKNFEFIIIDDGSTDNSVDTIRSFKDPRIWVIQQSNSGLVNALNLGVQLAQTSLIARMDQDDISLPQRLEKEVQFINTNPQIGLVGTFFSYIDEKGKRLPIDITPPTKDIDLKRSFYLVNPFGHGVTVYRKVAYDQAGGYRDIYGPTEDFDLWRRIAERWELAIIPESLYLYRISKNSMSHHQNEIQHYYSNKIIKEQWAKPLIRKNFSEIINDAKYYRGLKSAYANAVYSQYIDDQCNIAIGLLARGHAKSGTITASTVWWLNKSVWRMLWRPIIGGWLIRAGVRRSKII